MNASLHFIIYIRPGEVKQKTQKQQKVSVCVWVKTVAGWPGLSYIHITWRTKVAQLIWLWRNCIFAHLFDRWINFAFNRLNQKDKLLVEVDNIPFSWKMDFKKVKKRTKNHECSEIKWPRKRKIEKKKKIAGVFTSNKATDLNWIIHCFNWKSWMVFSLTSSRQQRRIIQIATIFLCFVVMVSIWANHSSIVV